MAAAVVVGAAAAWAFVRWKPFRVEVRGDSMSPALEPGDFVLATAPGRLRHGDVVVIEHPRRPGFEMVKRVTGLPGDLAPDGSVLAPHEIWVEGDNPPASTDSRHFGAVGRELVTARVRVVWWPPARRRRL